MANIDKKVNKLKEFVAEHELAFTIIGYGLFSYALGLGVGYCCGRPSKEFINVMKKGTRGGYALNLPEEYVKTASEVFGDAMDHVAALGIQPNDRIVDAVLVIAKSET